MTHKQRSLDILRARNQQAKAATQPTAPTTYLVLTERQALLLQRHMAAADLARVQAAAAQDAAKAAAAMVLAQHDIGDAELVRITDERPPRLEVRVLATPPG
jgi:hypothetical protein